MVKAKKCECVIIGSTSRPDSVSIRGAEDRDIRNTMTDAGFKAGDEVVIVSKAHYEELLSMVDVFD